MSDSDDDFSEFINCYTSSSVKNNFRKQFNFITSEVKNDSNPANTNVKVLQNTVKLVDADITLQKSSTDDLQCSADNSELLSGNIYVDPPVSANQKNDASNSSTKPKQISDSSSKNSSSSLNEPSQPSKTTDSSCQNTVSQSSGEIYYSGTVENVAVEKTNCRYNTRSKAKISTPVAVVAPNKKNTPVAVVAPTKKKKVKTIAKATKAKKLKNSEPACIELLDDSLKEPDTVDDINYETSVKVIWKSMNVIRFSVRRLQKLSIIFEALMKQENVTLNQIFLTLRNEPVKPSDTPDSLNLNVCDFLEGGIVSKMAEKEPEKKKQPSYFLNFQYESKKVISLATKLNDPMKKVMLLFAEQIEKPISSVRFLVDGEEISGSDTPKSLDLEKGDIIDVVISK